MAVLKNLFVSRGHIRDVIASNGELTVLSLSAAAIKAAGFVPGDKVYGFLAGSVHNNSVNLVGGARLAVQTSAYSYGVGADLSAAAYVEAAGTGTDAYPSSLMVYEVTFTDDGGGDVAESLHIEAVQFDANTVGLNDAFHGIVEADSDVFAAFDEVDHSDLSLQTTYTGGATTGALPANTNGYQLIAQAQGRPSVVARDFKTHIHDGTSVLGAEDIRESEDIDERLNAGHVWTVGNGGGTYTVRAAAENNDDIRLAYTKIMAIDLDQLVAYSAASNLTEQQAPNQGYSLAYGPTTFDESRGHDLWALGGYRLKLNRNAGYKPNWFFRQGVVGGSPNAEFGGVYSWTQSGTVAAHGTNDELWHFRMRAATPADAGNPDEGTFQFRCVDGVYTNPAYTDGAALFLTDWDKVEGGTTAVSKSLDLRWSALNSLGLDIDARWNVLNSLGLDIDARWNVQQTVGGSFDLRWSVQETVGGSFDLRWDVDSVVTNPIDLVAVDDGAMYEGEPGNITGSGLSFVLTMTISDGVTTAQQTVAAGSDVSRGFTASFEDLPYTLDHGAGRLNDSHDVEVSD